MAKYFIKTFGCQMNISDSERIGALLEKLDFKPASTINEAGLIVVNMCSVRQSAVDRVYGLLPKIQLLKQKHQKIKTILTGCILEKDKRKFAQSFDYILGKQALFTWLTKKAKGKILKKELSDKKSYLNIIPKHLSSAIAFVPISVGCNNFCSYCVVPYTRGKLVCRSHRKIIEEVRTFVKKGAKEIWLLGENVNDYYSKSKIKSQKSKIINFAKLLKTINKIKGNFWICFTSPNPADFSDELIKAIAQSEKVTSYLNLPLQSGDNEILKKMNRKYTMEEYLNLVKRIRSAFRKYRKGLEKEISLSTDIIVGFPGETKKQFENTKRIMQEIKFDMAYIAKFSPRPGTAAFLMENNVSEKEKKRREKTLTNILRKTAKGRNKKFLGKTIDVLVCSAKNGFLLGKSRHNKTVKFKGRANLIGNFVKVKITKSFPWGLRGIKT